MPRTCRRDRSRRSPCATSAWPSSSACSWASGSRWSGSCWTPASRAPTTSARSRTRPCSAGSCSTATRPSSRLLSDLPPHSPRVEAFRILRTNLQFVDVDKKLKVFVVTSSVPGEGKTSTASNTALALQTAGQRTLLIDGDMRRPQLAKLFDLEGSVGLTSVLLGRVSLEEAVQEHRPSGLSVLTSGSLPPNPAELLQSHAMEQLLEKARTDFDVIVIDAPPLLPVTDAALIAVAGGRRGPRRPSGQDDARPVLHLDGAPAGRRRPAARHHDEHGRPAGAQGLRLRVWLRLWLRAHRGRRRTRSRSRRRAGR